MRTESIQSFTDDNLASSTGVVAVYTEPEWVRPHQQRVNLTSAGATSAQPRSLDQIIASRIHEDHRAAAGVGSGRRLTATALNQDLETLVEAAVEAKSLEVKEPARSNAPSEADLPSASGGAGAAISSEQCPAVLTWTADHERTLKCNGVIVQVDSERRAARILLLDETTGSTLSLW